MLNTQDVMRFLGSKTAEQSTPAQVCLVLGWIYDPENSMSILEIAHKLEISDTTAKHLLKLGESVCRRFLARENSEKIIAAKLANTNPSRIYLSGLGFFTRANLVHLSTNGIRTIEDLTNIPQKEFLWIIYLCPRLGKQIKEFLELHQKIMQ